MVWVVCSLCGWAVGFAVGFWPGWIGLGFGDLLLGLCGIAFAGLCLSIVVLDCVGRSVWGLV